VDGFCSRCGTKDPNYTDPVVIPEVVMKGATLSFEDEILVNLYYTVSDTTSVVENGVLVFYTDPVNADITKADAVYTGSPADDRYIATTEGIAAKEMGDERYYCAFAKLEKGEYVYSKVGAYSPKIYSEKMLAKADTSAKQKVLCVAMLNYGAAAQTYFNYRTDALMNAGLTAEQKALVVAYDESYFTGAVDASASKVGGFASTETGYTRKQLTVSFEGAFAMNYYFQPSEAVNGDVKMYVWTAADYAAASKLTAANASAVIDTQKLADGRYWGQVQDIAAKQIDETYYVAGVYTDVNGNVHCTGVVAYSLSKYCMNQAKPGMAMQELAAATAMYGYYAAQYFAN
jgi:hypothetical protein